MGEQRAPLSLDQLLEMMYGVKPRELSPEESLHREKLMEEAAKKDPSPIGQKDTSSSNR